MQLLNSRVKDKNEREATLAKTCGKLLLSCSLCGCVVKAASHTKEKQAEELLEY